MHTVVTLLDWPFELHTQTCVSCSQANEARELTGLWTRRYLEQQLLTTLAGRAGALVLFGCLAWSEDDPVTADGGRAGGVGR